MDMNPINGRPYSEKYWQILEKRRQLPIFEHEETFMKMLNDNQCVLVVGDRGTGKSTQIPQWCVDYIRQKPATGQRRLVACTQPRRMAAMTIATRVADEMDVQLGQEVGYSIRFEDCISDKTVLKYCTDGALLREAVRCPSLDEYGIVILDEVDERTLCTDALMGLLKELMKHHADIKVIVISADKGKLQNYFGDCPVMTVPGPVRIDEIHGNLQERPEILRSNLSSIVLLLKKFGVDDLSQFDFMDHPAPEALKEGLKSLKNLGALDNDGKLTELGSLMAEFPLDPQLAQVLIRSTELSCSNEVLSITAMMSVPQCFLRPTGKEMEADSAKAQFVDVQEDRLTLLNVYNAFKWSNESEEWCSNNFIDYHVMKNAGIVRAHLEKTMERLDLSRTSIDVNSENLDVNIRKALAAGSY